MQTLHILNNGGNFAACNYPFSESGVTSESIELNDTDAEKALSYRWKISDRNSDVLTFAEEQAVIDIETAEATISAQKQELKNKFVNNNYVQADLAAALALLL